MITPQHPLPLTRQCQLLALPRSSVYYTPQPVSAEDLALMRQLDELHLEYPFAGSRLLRDLLRLRGVRIGRKHVATLMRRMGIEALYRHPRTTPSHPRHQVFPYLLRELAITVPNQVWAMDLTYIPMRHGFLYLVAVLDWATRRVLTWRLSNTMSTDVCLDALAAAICEYGCPEILHTDQGSQFTSTTFVSLVQQHGIRFSMDGKGAWRDNLFVERLWKSVKYEAVYLHGYDSVPAARQGLARYFTFYNSGRPRSTAFRMGHLPLRVRYAPPLLRASAYPERRLENSPGDTRSSCPRSSQRGCGLARSKSGIWTGIDAA